MPFKSEKQRKWMHANEPEMADKWEKEEESVNEKMGPEQYHKYMQYVFDTQFKTPEEKKMKKSIIKKINKAQKKKGLPVFKEERDYKAEYKKFQSSTKAKKYRAELNQYNRKKGTYGNGDGKDASHKGGKIVGFEAQSKNRGRAEKSRLKKEGKLDRIGSHLIKDLDKKFKGKKGTTSTFNKIKKELKRKMSGVSDMVAGSIANQYNDFLLDKDLDDKEKIRLMAGTLKRLGMKESVNEAVDKTGIIKKQFPWAKGKMVDAIKMMIEMDADGLAGILKNMKKNPKAFKQFVKDLSKMRGMNESGLQYRMGVKRYGKEGMTKIQSAAGSGADHAEIGAIKDKYDKKKKKKKKESVMIAHLVDMIREELEKYDGGYSKEWNKQRKKNAEVLGYKLSGKNDIKESAVSFWQDMFRPGPIPKKYINQLIKKKGELPSKSHIKKIYKDNGNPSSSELAKSWKQLTKEKYVRAASGMWRWNADFTGWESVNEAEMIHVLTKDIGKKKMKDLEQYLWHVLDLEHNKDFRLSSNGKILSVNIDKINSKSVQNIKKRYGVDLHSHLGFQIRGMEIAINMAGNMTGAVKKIEKIKKGLSKDKKVADVLRKMNESVNEAKKPRYTKDGKLIITKARWLRLPDYAKLRKKGVEHVLSSDPKKKGRSKYIPVQIESINYDKWINEGFDKYSLNNLLDSKLKKRLERAIKLWSGKVDAVGDDYIKFRMSSSDVSRFPALLKKLDHNKNVWIGDRRKTNVWDRKQNIDKLNEGSTIPSAGAKQHVDDGPRYWWGDRGSYESHQDKLAGKLGWEVVDWIMKKNTKMWGNADPKSADYPGKFDINLYRGKDVDPGGPTGAVSYGPTGITGKKGGTKQFSVDNMAKGFSLWEDHIKFILKNLGWEILDYMGAEGVLMNTMPPEEHPEDTKHDRKSEKGKVTEAMTATSPAYSSSEAQKHVDRDVTIMSKFIGKASQQVIKTMMDGVKSGRYDAMDLQRGFQSGPAKRTHYGEMDFIQQLWRKVRDGFRRYSKDRKLR